MCDKIMEISPISISSSWAGPNPEGHMQPMHCCCCCCCCPGCPEGPVGAGDTIVTHVPVSGWAPRASRDPRILSARLSPCNAMAPLGQGLGDDPRGGSDPTPPAPPSRPAQVLPAAGLAGLYRGCCAEWKNTRATEREAKSGRGQGEQLPGPCWKGRAGKGPEPARRAQPQQPGLHCTAWELARGAARNKPVCVATGNTATAAS